MSRDLAIVVADQEMRAVIAALLTKRRRSLAIRALDFDPQTDLVVDSAGKDSGCYLHGAALLGPFRKTHRHGLVLLDEKWGGSPGAHAIEEKVAADLKVEWGDDAKVVVIAPELEVWTFIQSPHFSAALRWPEHHGPLREWLEKQGAWPAESLKPTSPKMALHLCARQGGVRITPRWFDDFASGSVGLGGCTDAAFRKLVAALQRWFPAA